MDCSGLRDKRPEAGGDDNLSLASAVPGLDQVPAAVDRRIEDQRAAMAVVGQV